MQRNVDRNAAIEFVRKFCRTIFHIGKTFYGKIRQEHVYEHDLLQMLLLLATAVLFIFRESCCNTVFIFTVV